MFNTNSKQSDILEKFRIKAHLRTFIKDPIIIDDELLSGAVRELKKLPYIDKDPSDRVAKNLVLEAYRLGHFNNNDLTKEGYELVSHDKYRGHQKMVNIRLLNAQIARNSYIVKMI